MCFYSSTEIPEFRNNCSIVKHMHLYAATAGIKVEFSNVVSWFFFIAEREVTVRWIKCTYDNKNNDCFSHFQIFLLKAGKKKCSYIMGKNLYQELSILNISRESSWWLYHWGTNVLINKSFLQVLRLAVEQMGCFLTA